MPRRKSGNGAAAAGKPNCGNAALNYRSKAVETCNHCVQSGFYTKAFLKAAGGNRREFMRKRVMAIAAALALGAATIATGAVAQHGPGGGHGGGGGGGAMVSGGANAGGGGRGAAFGGGGGPGFGGGAPMMSAAPRGGGGMTFGGSGRTFHRGTFNGGRFAFRHHRHFRGGFGLFAFGGPYLYDDGCWRWRRVWTPFGWRWRRVDICY
jgi:hypothetical protein